MPKCVYCFKDEKGTSFDRREHVIPRFLGTFDSKNPIIKGNLICDQSNGEIFSKLETNFKEDSYEGVFGQMLNLEGHSSIRLRGRNVKMKLDWDMGDSFFNDIFPFLKFEDGEFRAYPTAQIQLKNYDGVYQIFLPEALEKIKKNKSKFLRTKEKIKNLKNEDIHIFAGGEALDDKIKLDEITLLLKDFGKSYNEKSRKFSRITPDQNRKVGFDIGFSVNKDICRVIAKIAFNYFIYCLKEDGLESLSYRKEFDNIRGFILGNNSLEMKEIVNPLSRDCILLAEKTSYKRLVAHMVVFQLIENKIIASVTLFGKQVYDVFIGEAPAELLRDDFGCGHAFNPFDKRIVNLKQNLKENLTEEDFKISFGVFKRTL